MLTHKQIWSAIDALAARITTPEELGALAAFLCSDAVAQLSGVALPVDGGWLAR